MWMVAAARCARRREPVRFWGVDADAESDVVSVVFSRLYVPMTAYCVCPGEGQKAMQLGGRARVRDWMEGVGSIFLAELKIGSGLW